MIARKMINTKINDSSSFISRAKRLLMNPLRALLVVMGTMILFFSLHAHAYQGYTPVTVSLSTNTVDLQAGSELPVSINVQLPSNLQSPARVWFEIVNPTQLSVDGQLNRIDSWISLSREMRVKANSSATAGTYFVTVRTHTLLDSNEYIDTDVLTVNVYPATRVTYFTSPNTTVSPSIANIAFSQSTIPMHRTENTTFSVSFLHKGSATDYLIRFSENPIGLNARISNEVHRFVENGQSVTSFVEISTTSNSPFQPIPLRMEAYNLVSGEKTFLGTVLVNIQKVSNVELNIPFHSFTIAQNSEMETFLTLTNPEANDIDVIIETTSSFVLPAQHQLNIPSRSSVSIPLRLVAGSELGSRSETVYVLNRDVSKSQSFIVKVVEASDVPPVSEDENGFGSPTPGSGLVTGALSSWLGILIIVIAGLLVFSKDFRGWVQDKLPKSAPPAYPPVIKDNPDAAPMNKDNTLVKDQVSSQKFKTIKHDSPKNEKK